MSRSAANVLACHFAAQDDTYVHAEQQVAGDAAIAALAAAGLTVVPDGQVQLGDQRWEVDASTFGDLSKLARFAKFVGSITVRMLPVDEPK